MSRTVQCPKLGKEAEGLAFVPYPGDLGQRIFDNISQEAWQLWLNHQTMLINERHLDLSEKENRKWLSEQMALFLENKDYEKPAGFIPPGD